MSRLNDLIRQVGMNNPTLAADLQREVAALADRRAFGLNFERHQPEAVELPGRPVRKGDKVRILPPRGESRKAENDRLWRVTKIDRTATPARASVVALSDDGVTAEPVVDDLVVVAEFRDPIYPGLVSTGKVERGGDKPFHTVINAENYHALEALLFTHRGKVDCIYIDPPYNSGAKDWKYNNDYVEGDDLYRHSKWLAFMERRLLLAKELLNSDDSVLIVTIDEKEYLRLGLLLEQTFPDARIQMVSSVINPMGSRRAGEFSRVDEYLFFVMLGSAEIPDSTSNMLDKSQVKEPGKPVRWTPLNRDGNGWERAARPNMFYPIYIDPSSAKIVEVGEPIGRDQDRNSVTAPTGLIAVWPMKGNQEARWQVGAPTCRELIRGGWVTIAQLKPETGTATIRYLTSGAQEKVSAGTYSEVGRRADGSRIIETTDSVKERPRSVWNLSSHSARDFGTTFLGALLPQRRFPFPKSLYAVEDTIRFAVGDKRDSTVIDFFSGSGTTAHAVMRLNKQDGGLRQSISVTNNEVSSDEWKSLQDKGLRPGDPEWESHGICDFITKPRIQAAITGVTPEGEPISGDYKFTDEFPMADGFEENVEFFTLTYESPLRVASNRDFLRIAPLLWLRAGSRGRRIEDVSNGWDVSEGYGVLANLDKAEEFVTALKAQTEARIAFIVTDEDRLFETVVRSLPDGVEPVRLYEAYLRNFEIEAGRSLR